MRLETSFRPDALNAPVAEPHGLRHLSRTPMRRAGRFLGRCFLDHGKQAPNPSYPKIGVGDEPVQGFLAGLRRPAPYARIGCRPRALERASRLKLKRGFNS